MAALPTLAPDRLASLLVEGALPGEVVDFDRQSALAAAEVAKRAIDGFDGAPSVVVETASAPRRMVRLAIANDDMPFLVDSIAGAIAAEGLAIYRILHPVLDIGGRRISLIYVETERADARQRAALSSRLIATLADVRAATRDWPAMKAALAASAEHLAQGEGRALLEWFLDGKLTLLGSAHYSAGGTMTGALGIAEALGDGVLAPRRRAQARLWLDAHPGQPMLLKSNVIATVHRRAPLDLIVLPAEDGVVIHAALWTSAALLTPPAEVPVLRRRLTAVMLAQGFSTGGHAGKALAHALTDLPHDLLVAIDEACLERLALTAMSLADRPRPELVLVGDALDRHLFAFVWVPRDDLATQRRIAIEQMIGEAADAGLLSWTITLGDGEVALIRYTFDRRSSTRSPDATALRESLVRMLRGWAEAVEAALTEAIEPGRAAGLALRYADAFPAVYRSAAGPEEAALDIVRIQSLGTATARNVRLYRNPEDASTRLRLKLYSRQPVMLSDAVPALENFGFRVVEEMTTPVAGGELAHVHRFVLEVRGNATELLARAPTIEAALADVVAGLAENDRFNDLIVSAGFEPRPVLLMRAMFRYLRQTGLSYSLITVVDVLRRHPQIAHDVVALFAALHDPETVQPESAAAEAEASIRRGLAQVAAIDDDRILRRLAAVVRATLRTNFYVEASREALALKVDSAQVPGLPAPVPWREIWVYSPRVEGIHLRAGPVARGGLRWSDRRDDFRTEVLGLMKAQRVKNAIIVPTGAKGGFYPKLLPSPAVDRDAWLAEGTEAYRIFIRSLLSVTDNIVDGRVVHPAGIKVRDGADPYFVVAADKGTATFSDTANAIALQHSFWLGDAFASGGSVGYDHKAMGITARGAWISVQRHFAEMGIDVQTQPIRVIGCGDMSGDVFGNGMLLSKSIKLVAAFDHRHIFLDPDPDAAASWVERARLFELPRSSWADYSNTVISRGGGVYARTLKQVPLSAEARAMLGIDIEELEPDALISAMLKASVDLIWFGGIGTYIKAAEESDADVGDPANDSLRVEAREVRARVIGEGANLGVTQAGRIAFALNGGRINTDFIDNSAGVDCSDHEVNIKIALNAEVAAGALSMPERNALLADMTDPVAALVLEDNRLQTLALSIAERGGAAAVPSLLRLIETLEESGRLDRAVEGLPTNELLVRRAQDGRGLTRPELAVLLATSKLAVQDAIEAAGLAADPALTSELLEAFPERMQREHSDAIERHRLRNEIVATTVANRMINRMGLTHPFELAEEENADLGAVAGAFVLAETLFDIGELWQAIDAATMPESARLLVFEQIASELRGAMADLLRSAGDRSIGARLTALRAGIDRLEVEIDTLLRDEVRAQAVSLATQLRTAGVPAPIMEGVVRLANLDGAVGIATLADRSGIDPIALTQAFGSLGAALGLDWAQGAAMRLTPSDPWERLLVASLARDFQQMRLDFLAQGATSPSDRVDAWLTTEAQRIAEFRRLVDRARHGSTPTPAMLAQLAGQARGLLSQTA